MNDESQASKHTIVRDAGRAKGAWWAIVIGGTMIAASMAVGALQLQRLSAGTDAVVVLLDPNTGPWVQRNRDFGAESASYIARNTELLTGIYQALGVSTPTPRPTERREGGG